MVRKFFCRNKSCPRNVFTERFISDILPYARRLCRSIDVLRNIGLEVGGNKGAVIGHIVGSPVSPSTILRIVKQLEIEEAPPTSGIVGVDDWAFKKGRNYGSIIVNLEPKKVIDLLPDREADTLSQCLLRHPEIHTSGPCRCLSKGIKDSTANAIEVADRFHLPVDLREAFQKTLYRHNPVLKKALTEYSRPNIAPVTDPTDPVPEASSGPDKPDPKWQVKFVKAKELAGQGYSLKAIARILGAHRRTVRKYIRLEEFPRRQAPLNPR